ncbi:MAG: hypothetical protein IJK28_10590 [Clostridia bacterium]|nr:hypothetical protein [Clostridia bacterium]
MKNTRKVDFMDVDDIISDIRTMQERAAVIAEQVAEHFHYNGPTEAAMKEVALNYQRISVFVDIQQDVLFEIEKQLDRWDNIRSTLPEKKPVTSTAPGVRHNIVLTYEEPADGENLFTGFNRIHEKGEKPQPADKSLAQLAWIVERIREDDIFEFGEDRVNENLERLVAEAGIVLHRHDRPMFAAQQAGDILRNLFASWKKQTAPEEPEA